MAGSQKVFNFRHSRCRRVVENAFGLMTSRFRVFSGPILQSYENAVKTTKACVVLHNMLLTTQPPAALEDVDQVQAQEQVAQQNGGRGTAAAHQNRDRMADFFMNEGEVPFQWQQTFRAN
jgi:hypothetical protein